jgi:hypothetical protein
MTRMTTSIDPRLADFRNFLKLVWDHLGLPDPTPIQYDIAKYIQKGPRRAVVQAFRGVGKSYITSAYVVHQLLLDPSKTILVVSASKQRADDFSTFTLRLIEEMPILQHLRPRETQRYSKIAFDVGPAPAQHAPSVTSKGITSQLTGSRADLIVADDVEVPNNSATQMMREKLANAIKEFDAILKPSGRVLFLGTPQSEQSIYGVLTNRGYKTRIWPARRPQEDHEQTYGKMLAPVIRKLSYGEPSDPMRFPEVDLCEREMSFGRSGFALQFMLDTTLSDQDRYPLKLNDLIVMDCRGELAPEKLVWSSDPRLHRDDLYNLGFNGDRLHRPEQTLGEWIPFNGSVLAIDPSGRGSDETSYAVVKMLNGYLYVPECSGVPGGYSESTLTALAEIAKKHDVNYVIVEANFGDGMFTELLKPVLARIHPCAVEEVKHSIQKEKRIIDTLEPVMNSHRLVVDPNVIQDDYLSLGDSRIETALPYSLVYQMTRISRIKGALKHDDRLDALAMAVGYWAVVMAQDVDKRMDSRREEAMDRELRRFMACAIGSAPAQHGTNWIRT